MIILTKRDIAELQKIISLQSIMLSDDYMVGLYNGMETMLAMILQKEPKLYESTYRNCIFNNPNFNEKVNIIELSEVSHE